MKSSFRKATSIVATLVVFLGLLSFGSLGFGAPAEAYQVATTQASVNGGVATLSMPGSNLVTTYDQSGLTDLVGRARMDSRGYVATDFQQGMPATTPGVEFASNLINNCPASGTCSGLGTITISFNQPVRNPVLNIAGIGGNVYMDIGDDGNIDEQSQLHAVLNLATPGLSMTKLSGGNLAVSGNSITATNHNAGTSCETNVQNDSPDPWDAQATAACGAVRINGIVNTLTFNISAVFVPTLDNRPGYTNNDTSDPPHNTDNYVISMTVPQDFGDAPATYDQANAARAILSDVTLGPNVTEDNAQVANGTSSPNASATAALDQMDDGVILAPHVAGTTSYSTTVAISGASKAGTVCGWIDFDKDGIFDNPAERACATFAAGATTATLNWTAISSQVTAGTTYSRFRIGYNSTQTMLPTGASDSGEVEDYVFTITPAIVPAPAISLVKTVNKTTLVAGETATYTFVAKNTGNVTLTGVVISETQFSGTGTMSALSYTWPALPGVLLPGQSVTATATYVVTAADVTSGLLTNTAKVTGNPPLGNPVTATDDAQVSAPPAWKIKKTAAVDGNSSNGSEVSPGDTITYTVTATSVSGQITGVVLTDNLADVLDHAIFVSGSASLTIGTAAPIVVADPAAGSTTLVTAPFTLPAGQTATLRYSVTIHDDAWSAELVNVVTGNASTPPLSCPTGSGTPAPDCTTTHRTPAKILIEKIGESSDSTWVPMAGSTWAIHDDASGTPGALNTSYPVEAITGQTGQFQLEGIQPGVYWLHEITAPDGFSLLAEPVQFTVAPDGSVSLGQGSGTGVVTTSDVDGDGIFLVTVRDVPALELPESGGIGWWPFTVAGSMLLLTSALMAAGTSRRQKVRSASS
ncbi:GEVED domain-containing protein [Paenarthrobacter sp. NPDC089322]|uniref:DUF7507 domain-containing protein n=1 Tax=Paenarthrobacter sp. NPDC089322 TaxID=3155065 RepID=UPI00341CEA57